MPTVSPFLNNLLNQWQEHVLALRKEAAFQKEMMDPIALATHGNHMASRERRRRDLRHLEQLIQDSRMRWDERLNRIEEWKNKAIRIGEEQTRLLQWIQAGAWLEKARRYQDTFIQRLERGAVRVETGTQILHFKLENWLNALQERETALAELAAKARGTDGAFCLSRARKQPEIDFLNEQNAISDALGSEMHTMRHFLTHLRNRLQKTLITIEQRASGAEIFYELHKQELLSAFRKMGMTLDKRRDELLSEALVNESGRYTLRKLQNIVNAIPCLEDLSKTKTGVFARLSRLLQKPTVHH